MCANCRFFSIPDDRQVPRGFGRCALLDVWQYRSRLAQICHFTPSRFAAGAGGAA